MQSLADSTLPRPLISVGALQLIVTALIVLRLFFLFGVAPLGDEAYYWIWGQHPDLSYFDHPPLNAWLLSLSARLFGWTILGLRFPTLLTTAGSLFIFWLWSRRTGDAARWFWTAAAVYLATPIVAIFSGMVFPDHLLIFLCLFALYAFSRFFETWDQGHPAWRYLFLAAIVVGFAALTKYSAVFVGIAVVLHILLSPIRWRLLWHWQLYAAALLSLLAVSPVLIWNLQHGFASFRYNLIERQGDYFDLELQRLGYFVLFAVIYIGPFLLLPIAKLLLSRSRDGLLPAGRDLGRLTFLGSSLFFGFLGAGVGALPYWNIVAYAALFPHLAAYLGARLLLILHLLYGGVLIGLFLVNYSVLPLVHLVGGADWESSVVYGWDEIEQQVAAAELEHQPDFLAATRYTLAAQLSFARGRDDVTALSPRRDQYDFWFDPAAHAGQTALILADTSYGLAGEDAAHFASVTEIARFDTVRFSRVMNTYVLYLAAGFGEGSAGLPARLE